MIRKEVVSKYRMASTGQLHFGPQERWVFTISISLFVARFLLRDELAVVSSADQLLDTLSSP